MAQYNSRKEEKNMFWSVFLSKSLTNDSGIVIEASFLSFKYEWLVTE